MGGKLKRFIVPAVIGFAPLVLFLLNWDAETMSRTAHMLREYTLPVLVAELFTIIVALREGMLASWDELRPPRAALAALAVLLAVAVGTAVLVAPAPVAAATRTSFWFVHLLFGFSIAFLCMRLFDAEDLVAAYLAGFAALAVAFIIFAAGAMHRPIDWTWDLPSFLHIRHLGIYATPMIGFCVAIMANARRKAVWAMAFAIAATGFGLTLWTGSRGPIPAIAAAVAVGLIVSPVMRRPAAWGGAALSLAVAYCAVAWIPVPASNMGASRTIAATAHSSDITTGRTTELWPLVGRAIERRPLFGYGDGQMRAVAPYGRMGQPHNLILQVLLAWGVVGLVCVLALGLFFVRIAFPEVRRDPREALPPFIAMCALLTLSMIDAALYHILPVSIFAACAGMIAAGWRKGGGRPPERAG